MHETAFVLLYLVQFCGHGGVNGLRQIAGADNIVIK
jgi:hypothetical protein